MMVVETMGPIAPSGCPCALRAPGQPEGACQRPKNTECMGEQVQWGDTIIVIAIERSRVISLVAEQHCFIEHVANGERTLFEIGVVLTKAKLHHLLGARSRVIV